MQIQMQIVVSLISAIITGVIGYIFYKLKKATEEKSANEERRLQAILKREESINEALRALCNDRILQGYRYYKKNGGVSIQDLETMSKLYNAYHNLGGNGTITAVYEKISQLPIIEGD